MRKKILFGVTSITLLAGSFLLGANAGKQSEIKKVESGRYLDRNSEEFHENFIDMREVIDFESTYTGIILYLESGDGYYWGK